MWRFLISTVLLTSTVLADVKTLKYSNFDKDVTKSQNIWAVQFNDGKHSETFSKLAKNLEGIVKFGGIDVSKEQKLVKRFGAKKGDMKLFLDAKAKPVSYDGPDDVEKIALFIQEQIVELVKLRAQGKSSPPKVEKPKKFEMKMLKEANFEKTITNSGEKIWMVLFFAPWCGHCKKFEPEFRKAGEKMAGKVDFAMVDCTQNEKLCGKYGVQGYPTTKFFGLGGSSDVQDYNGGRDTASVVEFASQKFEKLMKKVEVFEGVDKETVEKACADKSLCVFAFLPNILDCQSGCRNDYLKVLKKVADVFKGRNWGWIWNEGAAQPELENTFDIGGFGYPALAIWSPTKSRYSTMRGSFSPDSIKEFLTSIGAGRLKVDVLDEAKLDEQKFLKIAKIEKWDGKDGEVPKEEL